MKQSLASRMVILCQECGKEIENVKTWKEKLCKNCKLIKKNKYMNNYMKDYISSNPELRKKRIENSAIRNAQRNGSSGIGPHLSKKGAIPDFERERKIIFKEKKRVFRRGCGWLSNGVDSIRWAEKKLDLSRRGCIQYLPKPNIINFEDVCSHCCYASFPNGIQEKGICGLGKKPDGIWDTSKMCYEMLNAK